MYLPVENGKGKKPYNGAARRMGMCEKAEITNMCMVYDGEGNILVQERLDPRWPGVTFPGGHVKKNESFTQAVIREVREETGLTIEVPKLCGVKQFLTDADARYIVLFYKTDRFSGSLRDSEEGRVFWISAADLKNYRLAKDFEEMYRIFADDGLQEFFWERNDEHWIKHIY